MIETIPSMSSFTEEEIREFNSWIVYLNGGFYCNKEVMVHGAGDVFDRYCHFKSHLDFKKSYSEDYSSETAGMNATSSETAGMNATSTEFHSLTGYTAERLYDYMESLSGEAKAKNTTLRKVAEERAISILDLK